MHTIRFSLLSMALLALTACQPSESSQAAQNASAASNAPTSAASAPHDLAASASSEPATAAASTPTTTYAEIGSAKWQNYTCDDNKTITARYASSGANAEAQIKYAGQTIALKFDPEQSNDDLTAFTGNDLTWTIGNQFGDGHFYQEGDGFLTRHEQVEISGDTEQVDSILLQNCMPKK